ncbi:hypothetical protein LPB86_09065 [Pedobacter sp. MC2016-14]|uniref:hypothetical protein n=1 Tax=Pedobacter sp. MC2016-14 TaxID=2897327 RepID=UPI001E423C01|nr:hypothetical protein [Pedobacter sp. MC2016-14]MCD0488379.1 hypothetical protein [Pedobacter sp. MC2016-14]
MKKILLLLLCTITLGLVSCQKDEIIQDTPNRTIIIYIEPNQWVSSNNGANYTAELSIPEIDRTNVDIEGILVYLDHPVNVNSYIQLPYVYSGNSYSYEQFNGGIAVDLQRSEYTTQNPTRPSVRIRAKIVLIPSVDVT